MRLAFLAILMFQAGSIRGQYRLHLQVEAWPSDHLPGEPIFVSGNFNGWKPDDERYRLRPEKDGTLGIQIFYSEIPGDRFEFKFTRGSWMTSESTERGRLTGPRIAPIYQDTTLICQIRGWRDDFPASTASENLHTLDSAFYIPQLDRYRHIWIYLPEDYYRTKDKYPVLYMNDGQHLFDEATSVGRIGPIEWAVDETLDTVENPCIIVGIDHNEDMEKRVSEYYYYSPDDFVQAEGPDYLRFIVETLKPYVDLHYRTLTAVENTGICGSSMGGLISLYAGIHYPDVFGKIGVFSPSVWLDNGHVETEIEQLKSREVVHRQKYFFYAGGQENRLKEDNTFVQMAEDVDRIIGILEKKAEPEIRLLFNPYGRHGALYWREAFPVFYEWLVTEGFMRTR